MAESERESNWLTDGQFVRRVLIVAVVVIVVVALALTFMPNFGSLVALIPPTVLALRDGPMWALAIVVFYVVVF